MFRFLFLALVEDPLQRAAVAESAGPGFGRDAGAGGVGVEEDAAASFSAPRSVSFFRFPVKRIPSSVESSRTTLL